MRCLPPIFSRLSPRSSVVKLASSTRRRGKSRGEGHGKGGGGARGGERRTERRRRLDIAQLKIAQADYLSVVCRPDGAPDGGGDRVQWLRDLAHRDHRGRATDEFGAAVLR